MEKLRMYAPAVDPSPETKSLIFATFELTRNVTLPLLPPVVR
jgi:hypothetical protein